MKISLMQVSIADMDLPPCEGGIHRITNLVRHCRICGSRLSTYNKRTECERHLVSYESRSVSLAYVRERQRKRRKREKDQTAILDTGS